MNKGYTYIITGIICALISIITTSYTISNMMPFYVQIQIILKGILYVGAAVTGYGIYTLMTEKWLSDFITSNLLMIQIPFIQPPSIGNDIPVI